MSYSGGMNAMTGAIQGGLGIRDDRRAQDKHDMNVTAYRAAMAEAGQGGPAPAGASPDGQAPVAAGLPAPSLPRAGRGSYADMMAAAAAYGNGQYTAGANIRSAVEERRKTEEFNGLYADAASQIAKLSEEDRDAAIHRAVNTTGGIPGVLWQSKDKNGYMVMLTDPKTGRPVATGDDGMPYSAFLDKARADQILTYGLLAQMNPSYAQTAHAKLAELHNTLYERGERLDTRETAAVQTQNQAVRFGHQNEHDAAMLEQRKREVNSTVGRNHLLNEQAREALPDPALTERWNNLAAQYSQLSPDDPQRKKLFSDMQVVQAQLYTKMRKVMPLRADGAALDPKDYAATVASFTQAGAPLEQALMRADELYGRGRPQNAASPELVERNAQARSGAGAGTPRLADVTATWEGDENGRPVWNYGGRTFASKAEADAARSGDEGRVAAAHRVPEIIPVRDYRSTREGLGAVLGYDFNGVRYRTAAEARMAQDAYRASVTPKAIRGLQVPTAR